MNNAKECLNEIGRYLFGEGAFVPDTCGGNQCNDFIVKRIKEMYRPRRYVRKDRRTALRKQIKALRSKYKQDGV